MVGSMRWFPWFKVVTNRAMSEDVISAVPQGKVIPSVLFIIMTSDSDREVEVSTVPSSADDIRVSKMTGSEDHKKKNADLDIICYWTGENLVESNEE